MKLVRFALILLPLSGLAASGALAQQSHATRGKESPNGVSPTNPTVQ
jgi:hypothetical protein